MNDTDSTPLADKLIKVQQMDTLERLGAAARVCSYLTLRYENDVYTAQARWSVGRLGEYRQRSFSAPSVLGLLNSLAMALPLQNADEQDDGAGRHAMRPGNPRRGHGLA